VDTEQGATIKSDSGSERRPDENARMLGGYWMQPQEASNSERPPDGCLRPCRTHHDFVIRRRGSVWTIFALDASGPVGKWTP